MKMEAVADRYHGQAVNPVCIIVPRKYCGFTHASFASCTSLSNRFA